MHKLLHRLAFGVGLLVVVWVAAGALATSPLALAITVAIGVFYVMGAVELHHHDQATAALERAVAGLAAPVSDLDRWLATLPAPLRPPVRARVEGERAVLPGPTLTPYLAGLLVLLGMLGTFLGMVVTLRGTGLALEQSTDLQTMRDSLSAPVKGLGLAFGTSVAGVASSAMLGLMAALSRRARLVALQALEAGLATGLRAYSRGQREDAQQRALQAQAEALPALVDRVQALLEAVERQGAALEQRLVGDQQRFHDDTAATYRELAASVDRSLRAGLAEGARAAAETIGPLAQTTMAGIARDTSALHERVSDAVQRQLDGLALRFEAGTRGMTETWTAALERHETRSEALAERLGSALDAYSRGFEQRSAAWSDAVAARHAEWQDAMAATLTRLAGETATLHAGIADTTARQIDAVGARLDASTAQLAQTWAQLLARHDERSARQADETGRALAAASAAFGEQGSALIERLERQHGEAQAAWAARDDARLSVWTERLDAVATTLQAGWDAAGERSAAVQARLADSLAAAAQQVGDSAGAQARQTIDEVTRLVEVAAEAPRAAADVIAQLRTQLSESLARDNAVLEERGRLMATLDTLLESVRHGATAQREALDALLTRTADVLEQVGSRFAAQIDGQTQRIDDAAAEVASGAVEVASLGEAFGQAVQLFERSSERLTSQLQRIEVALGQSLARSDEQLAYYVAQAREVIDLSLMSQQQILEDLRRGTERREAETSEA